MDLPDKKTGGAAKKCGEMEDFVGELGRILYDMIVGRYVDLIRTNAEFTKTNVAVTGTTINGVYFCWNNSGFSQAVQPGSN